VLLKKFFNVGFEDIRVVERRSVGLEQIGLYPLFAADFLDLLRRLTPEENHSELVFSITVTARKPS
jgi:hypothetical protein